jgi:hypothetical protein
LQQVKRCARPIWAKNFSCKSVPPGTTGVSFNIENENAVIHARSDRMGLNGTECHRFTDGKRHPSGVKSNPASLGLDSSLVQRQLVQPAKKRARPNQLLRALLMKF